MIFKKEMFACKCDGCGKEWIDDHTGFCAFSDESSIENHVSDDYDWHITNDNKHYCSECFTFDENDNLIIHNKL